MQRCKSSFEIVHERTLINLNNLNVILVTGWTFRHDFSTLAPSGGFRLCDKFCNKHVYRVYVICETDIYISVELKVSGYVVVDKFHSVTKFPVDPRQHSKVYIYIHDTLPW